MNLDWRAKTFLVGGVVGALFGLGAAYMYVRAAEEQGEVPSVEPRQAMGLGLALLAVLRQIAALPAGDKAEA